jgi:copper chaperone CopZ
MKTIVSIPGMHCASCAALIKDVSTEFPQIQNADVNVETKIVTLDHAENFDFATWKAEIESLGDAYKVLP